MREKRISCRYHRSGQRLDFRRMYVQGLLAAKALCDEWKKQAALSKSVSVTGYLPWTILGLICCAELVEIPQTSTKGCLEVLQNSRGRQTVLYPPEYRDGPSSIHFRQAAEQATALCFKTPHSRLDGSPHGGA